MSILQSPIQRPDSLSDVVYDSIRAAIVDRTLPPGARVSEAKLAGTLGVSKTPVREALLRLAQVGLIVVDGRRGGRVPESSDERLRGAYELREALEGQTAFLAANKARPEDIHVAEAAAEACLNCAVVGDIQGFRRYDKAFHLAVAHASHSPYLERSAVDTYDLVWTLRLRDSPPTDTAVECAHEHGRIIRAIASGTDSLAKDLMTDHVRKVRDSVLGAAVPGAKQ